MWAKHYENLIMLSKVTAKNVGDVFLRHTVCRPNTVTFKSLDVESSFLVYENILMGYRSSSFMKVIGSRSRSRQQNAKSPISAM